MRRRDRAACGPGGASYKSRPTHRHLRVLSEREDPRRAGLHTRGESSRTTYISVHRKAGAQPLPCTYMLPLRPWRVLYVRSLLLLALFGQVIRVGGVELLEGSARSKALILHRLEEGARREVVLVVPERHGDDRSDEKHTVE